MRKFLVIMIPIVTVILFIAIMNSDKVLKQPLGQHDNVPLSIQLVLKDVENEKWYEANIKVDGLSRSWNKVLKRIQFSAEKDEINELNMNIARLRGAISSKDRSAAIIELSEVHENWENLGK